MKQLIFEEKKESCSKKTDKQNKEARDTGTKLDIIYFDNDP